MGCCGGGGGGGRGRGRSGLRNLRRVRQGKKKLAKCVLTAGAKLIVKTS